MKFYFLFKFNNFLMINQNFSFEFNKYSDETANILENVFKYAQLKK